MSFIRSVTGICHERAEQRDEGTGQRADFESQGRFGANPAERSRRPDSLAREAKAQRAAQDAPRSSGPGDPCGRPLVRHSLGPDDPQHGFNGRRLCQQSRDVRGRPGQRPGFAGFGGRQLPGAQGRPSGPTRQGAVSDRSRDQKGGCRYGDGRPASGQVQSARYRSGGHEPAPGAGARHGERRRPGRRAARQGCRCGQEQSRARAGSGRLRPGRQIGGDKRYPKVGVRPPAGHLIGGPRGRCRGAGRCPSNPCVFGIAAERPTKQISARFRPISIKPFRLCSRRRRR